MFKNYLKITLRNLYREKLYALINIFGLSLGISCCLVLGLFISNELSYDRHFINHQNIYRVVNEYIFSGNGGSLALSSQALGPLLKKDNPEDIVSFTRFRASSLGEKTLFRNEANSYFWDKVFLADTNVFDVFNHDVIYGNLQGALEEGTSIAVSDSFARTYFGESNPVGQVLTTDSAQYEITLVFADLPDTSHLKYDVLISMNRLSPLPENEAVLNQMLGTVNFYTYVSMREGFNPASFERMFNRFSQERITTMAQSIGMDDFSARFWAQKLTDIHLNSDVNMDEPAGNRFYVYGFAAVAVFILLIACINYVNLATARSLKRAREVGMRKVLGADRSQLVWQFLGESVFFVLVALVFSLLLVVVILNFGLLENLLGSQIGVDALLHPGLLAALTGLSLLIGLLSGLYPAFYLSSVSPMVALASGSKNSRGSSGRLRQVLVLVQFTISIGIISSTLLMVNQMRYISDLPLGFEKENKVMVSLHGADLIESFPALRNELLSNANIISATNTIHVPGGLVALNGANIENNEGLMELQAFSAMAVGEGFMDTLGIRLVEGRDFTQKLLTDVGTSLLVNQAMVDSMGWDQAMGKRFVNGGGGTMGKVIGVVEDFHYDSLYQPIAPLVMEALQNNYANANAEGRALATQTMIVNISGQEVSQSLGFIRDLMLRFDPIHPFEYEFLDNQLDQLYKSEQTVMNITALFAAICIFISCMGLFGLASFTTEQRTKEIGVRKVLGASSLQIILLLARGILVLVLIGAVIASLISFLAINQWLGSFAYRETINPLIFTLAAIMALAVAFITVALQSLKTARSNPVRALRYE